MVLIIKGLHGFQYNLLSYLGYLKDSEERAGLEDALQHRQATVEEIPIIIDGKEYWTDNVHYQTMVFHNFCFKIITLILMFV